MMLKFERNIAFIDLETTGTDVTKDRIVEIAVVKLKIPSSEREVKTYRINPGITIPAGATKIHGISDADVADKPTFKQLGNGLLAFIKDCDLAGFNSNKFDFPLLLAEFNRNGFIWNPADHHFIDIRNIYVIKEERTLAAAVKFYTDKDIENAHSAEVDILATVDVFQEQINRYFSDDKVPMTIEELATFSNFGKKIIDLSGLFCYGEDGSTIYFAFGKHKGQIANDYKYLTWVALNSDFPKDTKDIARKLMKSM